MRWLRRLIRICRPFSPLPQPYLSFRPRELKGHLGDHLDDPEGEQITWMDVAANSPRLSLREISGDPIGEFIIRVKTGKEINFARVYIYICAFRSKWTRRKRRASLNPMLNPSNATTYASSRYLSPSIALFLFDVYFFHLEGGKSAFKGIRYLTSRRMHRSPPRRRTR